uniref:Putative nerolidol synthase n=1 Tax=Scoparia dulcis TaxID=107240 RepID=A0A5K7XXZ0_SCODU|nr:putative nerolidol synthase [Scoparia dulcis]
MDFSNVANGTSEFDHCAAPHVSQTSNTPEEWSISHEDIYTSSSVLNLLNTSHYAGNLSIEHERKIEEVRNLLKSKGESESPLDSLLFVDAIQRVGVSSHFQQEIETILRQMYTATSESMYGFNTLHDVSLLFRLLREHGLFISSDVFKNFRGKDGMFNVELSQDIRSLMELYEAAQFGVEGEDILDEAVEFSRQQLNKCSSELDIDGKWSKVVANTLRHPYHKSIARLTGKDFFMRDCKGLKEEERTLRELAILELHLGRSVYQQELLQVSRWWSGLGLAENLKIARNQPVKWYTWCMAGLIDDISLSQQRIELTKPIAFIYLIDDIYDLYGKLDELIIFTEAVNKWDYATIDMLPDYMKMCYRALLDTTNEIAHKIYEMHGYNPIDYLKAAWSTLCDAFLLEAKWLDFGKLPMADEYLENGKVSSGVPMVLVHLFFLLDNGGAHGGPKNLSDVSQLISNVATLLRLWDDLGTAKDENQDGKDGSYLDCYMQDNNGLVGLEQAREKVKDLIAKEWRSLNEECFHRNHFGSPSFKKACLNMARMIPLMYGYDDNRRLPVLQEYVYFTLFNNDLSSNLH